MTRIALVGASALAALAFAGSALAAAPTPLPREVGPGFTISLKKGSAKVTKLKAGRYVITVNDKGNIHNFHLTGPGVNKASGVASTGTTKWTVTLAKGTYRYVCDPHASAMNGSFT